MNPNFDWKHWTLIGLTVLTSLGVKISVDPNSVIGTLLNHPSVTVTVPEVSK